MLTHALVTDPGGRTVNEDSIGAFENGSLQCFVVCDGLGGHGMGDVASSLVRDCFGSRFETITEPKHFLNETFEDAQAKLLEKQKELKAAPKMKTTAVALLTDKKRAFIGHIGDSRLYVFYKDSISTRTLDHSLPQMLVRSGEIKEDEIRNHPERNIVMRVMGTKWEENHKYELMKPISLRKCQAFLLCTDGFWELIQESEMCDCLKESASVSEWLINMNSIVRKNGLQKGEDMDNYSAIAVWNI
ncbi:MAG: protein phosphatase 2C domain-containing protein [Acutalibacteraceae bacterium]|nr:protein phosphatase 2C domain-containing protein [Acutalibacteraceae bacterium]